MGEMVVAIPDPDIAIVTTTARGEILSRGIERERANGGPTVPERFNKRTPADGPKTPSAFATQMDAAVEPRYRHRLDDTVLGGPLVQKTPSCRIPQAGCFRFSSSRRVMSLLVSC